jgi:hypothetical protein
MYKRRFRPALHTVFLSMIKTNQPMFNEMTGVYCQNRRQKTAVWQNSEFVNVQWCGKCALLILVSGRLLRMGEKTETWYEYWLKCTSCRHDIYRIISEGTLACSNNSTVVPCSVPYSISHIVSVFIEFILSTGFEISFMNSLF